VSQIAPFPGRPQKDDHIMVAAPGRQEVLPYPAALPVRDRHHRLVCRGCGRTEDVDCVAGEWPCLAPPAGHGFVIDGAKVIFRGLCPACQPAPAK